MVTERIYRDPDEEVILHSEIQADISRIFKNMMSSASVNEKGYPIAVCEQIMFQIPTRPKTLQKRSGNKDAINRYKTQIRKSLVDNKKALDLIKDKGMLLYIIAYLTEENYINYDVDNIPKHFCDVLKEFTSTDKKSDNNIKTLIVEKRLINEKPLEAESIEECEEFLVFITHEMFRKYLFS